MAVAFVGGSAVGVKAGWGSAAVSTSSSSASSTARLGVVAPSRRVARGSSVLNMAITRPERYTSCDLIKNLGNLPNSRVLQRIRSHILANLAFAGAIYVIYRQFPNGELWNITPLPHTMLGTAMGLLLVFRTNSAYDRFWEGRKIWGAVVNRTRSLGINFLNWNGPTGDSPAPELSAKLIKLDQAFPRSLANHLRGQQEPDEILKQWIPAEHWEEYVTARNRPLFVCRLLSRYVAQAYEMKDERDGNTNAERETIERGINDFVDYMGMCERIVKTPVPLSYSRHTSRFLSLWCLTLPIIFVKQDDWLILPIMAFVSFSLFAIEEIGHCIEDPFIPNGFDLPLETISETIAGDLQNMLDTFESTLSDTQIATGSSSNGAVLGEDNIEEESIPARPQSGWAANRSI